MRSVILLVLSVAVFSGTSPPHADGRAAADFVAKGTRTFYVKLAKDDQEMFIQAGDMVDVIAEISEPIKTAVALQSVKVLQVDANEVKLGLSVQVTPIQAKVLALLQEDGARCVSSCLLPPRTKGSNWPAPGVFFQRPVAPVSPLFVPVKACSSNKGLA
jgi:hypothetical protein